VIRQFGQLSIEDGARRLGPTDLGGTRPKQVLEILLAARGHRVTTDRLGELVWGDERPQDAIGSLQTFVSSLRRHLDADRRRARALVVTEPEAYRFATELVALDLDRFDELLERSAREPTGKARRSLEEALALVRGDVLEDEPYNTWAVDLRGTYQGRILGAHLDAADAALAELDFAAALTHSEAAAALDRFSERAQRIAILALYALGRQHDALAGCERCRGHLVALCASAGFEPHIVYESDDMVLIQSRRPSLGWCARHEVERPATPSLCRNLRRLRPACSRRPSRRRHQGSPRRLSATCANRRDTHSPGAAQTAGAHVAHLWSRADAISGGQQRIREPRQWLKQAESVALDCR
jgi:DNA-binding SARP family transcriptional activator